MAKLRGIGIVAVFLLIVRVLLGPLQMGIWETILLIVGNGMMLGELFEDYLE